MNESTLKKLIQNEQARFQQDKVDADVEFLSSLRDMDLQSYSSKMTEAYIEAMKNRTLYRQSYGNFNTRTYDELGIDLSNFGTSRYDALARNEYEMRDPTDLRAREQGAFARLGSGLLRAASNTLTTTATPFVMIPGIVSGIANTSAENQRTGRNENGWQSFWAGFLDNKIMNTFMDFNDFVSTQLAPIYRTEEERSRGPLRNLTSSGFWAEDFVSNLGFTVGAMLGGKLMGRIGNALNEKIADKFNRTASKVISSKLGLNDDLTEFVQRIAAMENPTEKMLAVLDEALSLQKRRNFLSTTTGIIGGALTEAHTEALQAKRQMMQEGMAGIEQFYNEKNPAARMEYKQAIMDGDIPENMPFSAWLDEKKKQSSDQLEYRANQVMRNVYAFEAMLLTGTNAYLWRDWYDVSYRNGVNKVEENLKFVNVNGENPFRSTLNKKTPLRVSRFLKSFLTEGGEEWVQHGLNAGFEDYFGAKLNDDYAALRLQLNPKYREHVMSMGQGLLSGIKGMVSPEGLTEMFVGGLTGLVGMPASKYSKAQRKALGISVFNPKAYRMEGGIWDAYRKNKEQMTQAREFVAYLQKNFEEGTVLSDIIDSYSAALAAQHSELGAQLTGEKKKDLDARRDLFIKALDVYTRLGLRKEVEDHLDVLSNLNTLSDQERNIILRNAYDFVKTDENSEPSQENLDELQDKIQNFAAKQKKLITVYENFQKRLTELSNFADDNNLTALQKRIFISMIKQDMISIEDNKERHTSLKKRISNYSTALSDDLRSEEGRSDKLTQDPVGWLEENFKEIRDLLFLPYSSEIDGITSSYLTERDNLAKRITDKILKENQPIEVKAQANVFARDIIDLYIIEKDIERTAKHLAEPLKNIMKRAKELEKHLEEIQKKEEKAGTDRLLKDLDNIFDTIKGKAFDDATTQENFKSIKQLLDRLMNDDFNAFERFEAKALEKTPGQDGKPHYKNPRMAWYMWQYSYNNQKNNWVLNDFSLQGYEQYTQKLLDVMPYKFAVTLEQILNDPSTPEDVIRQLKTFKYKVEGLPFYTHSSTKVFTTPAKKKNEGEATSDDDAASREIVRKTDDEGNPKDVGEVSIPVETAIPDIYKTSLRPHIKKFVELLEGANITFDASEIDNGIVTVTNPYGFGSFDKDQTEREYAAGKIPSKLYLPDQFKRMSVSYKYNFYTNTLTVSSTFNDNGEIVEFFKTPFNIAITDFIYLFTSKYNDLLRGFKSPYNKYNAVNKVELDRKETLTTQIIHKIRKELENNNIDNITDNVVAHTFFYLFSTVDSQSSANDNAVWDGLVTKKTALQNPAVRKALSDVSNSILNIYSVFSSNLSKQPEKKDNPSGEKVIGKKNITYTERGYNDIENEALEKLNEKIQNGDGSIETLVDLLSIRNFPESGSRDEFIDQLAKLGYEPVDDEISAVKFIEDTFPNETSLSNAKGYFPIGYKFTLEGVEYTVSAIDENGKILEATGEDNIKLKYNGTRWYPERQVSPDSETQRDTERTSQKSTVQITEFPTTTTNERLETITNSIATPHSTLTSKLYKNHPEWCEYIKGFMEQVYKNIGEGKIHEGDDIHFIKYKIDEATPEGEALIKKDSKWLSKSRDLSTGYFVIAAINQNGDICGIISPSTYSDTHSELFDAIIDSGWSEENSRFNLVTKVKKVSNARERTMRLPNNAMHDLSNIADGSFDNLLVFAKFSTQPISINDNTNAVANNIELLYGTDKNEGQWGLSDGQIYILPHNSTGRATPSSTHQDIAIRVSVDSSEAALARVLQELVLSPEENNKAEIDYALNIFKRINNAFFVGSEYKIGVAQTTEGKLRFSLLRENFDEDSGKVEYTEVTNINDSGDRLIDNNSIEIDTSDPSQIASVANWLSKNKAKISYSKHSFYDNDITQHEGVNIRWLYDNGFLKTSAVLNRTSNAHVILDIELPGDKKANAEAKEQPEKKPDSYPSPRPTVVVTSLNSHNGLDKNYTLEANGLHGVDIYLNKKKGEILLRALKMDTIKQALEKDDMKSKLIELANANNIGADHILTQTPKKNNKQYDTRTGASSVIAKLFAAPAPQEAPTETPQPQPQPQQDNGTPAPEVLTEDNIVDTMIDALKNKLKEIIEDADEIKINNYIEKLKNGEYFESKLINDQTQSEIHEALTSLKTGDTDKIEEILSCGLA